MQIKKKTFQNFNNNNRIPVKQRLGLNRNNSQNNFKPWYRRNNWSARGGRGGRNFRGRNWGGNWGGGGGRSRSRSQSFSNIDR